MTSGQEALIIVLLVVVLVGLFGSGFFALMRERYRRGRDGDDEPLPTRRPRRRRRP
jgi:Tfp pilus assembly protein PilX